ncbi:solute carrier organic anion transporter family member 1A5-like [Meriones unguiculatus]|uniref:solute carrier organic anion transporter family member 1A5-like n=1 Tax=Meriones unguiculatus TaxID=10047 RepID=UPI00293E5FEA|nr:solute carrier organic anion transporter family member 1A5-like [Meriones unguiculatus]
MVGNVIRGIGETPIMPLGISYIEDFAKSENSPLYIGILETGKITGPLVGVLLGSFCARTYVDTGSVNTVNEIWRGNVGIIRMYHFILISAPLLAAICKQFITIYRHLPKRSRDDLTITPTDTRWVGAWWIGFLICAGMNILTSIPFFFFPKTLPKEGLEDIADGPKNDNEEKHREEDKEEKQKCGVTKDFLPFMKSLICNPIYMLFILTSVLQFTSFINIATFKPKYVEQQFGKSNAEAIFLMGLYNLIPICIGYLVGGYTMKKFKITVRKAAYIAFFLFLAEYPVSLCNFLMTCDNFPVAGLTTSYEGVQPPLDVENMVLADCNTRCSCLTKTWDPVCGDNGLAYMSACLAGCEKSVGTGINMVFQNCSCIGSSGNSSAVLGLCNKGRDCDNRMQYFLIISLICSVIYSLEAMPGFMVFLRCIKPEEKSLGVGFHAFCTRILAGIPAPIYIGALLDRTCLHWETLKCGEPGACRMYDINSFRRVYLGMSAALKASSFLPAFFILILVRKLQLPEEINSSESKPAEMKLTEKEGECMEVHRSPEVDNDGELKTKL